mgnify:CR=1 FL=1
MSIMHDVMYPPDRREYSKQAPLHKKSNHITEPGEVFYCKQCNRCYQDPVAKNLKNKDTVEYLQDFPTIGKEMCLKKLPSLMNLNQKRLWFQILPSGMVYGSVSLVITNIQRRIIMISDYILLFTFWALIIWGCSYLLSLQSKEE